MFALFFNPVNARFFRYYLGSSMKAETESTCLRTKVLRRLFGPKKGKVTEWRKYDNEEHQILYHLSSTYWAIRLRMREANNVACTGEVWNTKVGQKINSWGPYLESFIKFWIMGSAGWSYSWSIIFKHSPQNDQDIYHTMWWVFLFPVDRNPSPANSTPV